MTEQIKSFRFWFYFIPIIVALPSVIIGGIAMDVHNIPGIYFILNIACLIIGWIISCFAISINVKTGKKGEPVAYVKKQI